MSQDNVEIVRRAISHLNETGEPDWDLYTPDLIWITRGDAPAHNTYRASTGCLAYQGRRFDVAIGAQQTTVTLDSGDPMPVEAGGSTQTCARAGR